MLLSKRERLAEATISLAEIKATKNVLTEEEKKILSKENNEVRAQLVTQLDKNMNVFQVLLKYTAPTALRSFESFINQLQASTDKVYRILASNNLEDKRFYVEKEVAKGVHDLGVYTSLFLKKIPEIVADFDTFKEKAEKSPPDKTLLEIFDGSEVSGIKRRYKATLAENETIYTLLSSTGYEAEQESNQWKRISANMDSLLSNLKNAYADRKNRASEVDITVPDMTGAVNFDKDSFINELLNSKFSSINPMLGKLKIVKTGEQKEAELSGLRQEVIKKFLANPKSNKQDSVWPNEQLFIKALTKLQEKLSKFLEEDEEDEGQGQGSPTDQSVQVKGDGQEFVKFVVELLEEKDIEEANLVSMMKQVVKELAKEMKKPK